MRLRSIDCSPFLVRLRLREEILSKLAADLDMFGTRPTMIKGVFTRGQ